MRTIRHMFGLVGLAAGAALLAPAPLLARAREVAPRPALKAEEQATIDVFKEASPSVVYITSLNVRRDAFRLNLLEIPRGTGSGFIWDDAGHVVTNYHVVNGADAAKVTLEDQTTYDAKLVGAAPEKDIAVLQIEAPRSALHPIPIGSSHDLQVGQSVFAIGNPFGLDQTLTTGIISALGREIESIARIPIRDVIQTDAAINPGNSGGPLLDTAGRLIGVNAAIYSPSGAYAGIGFAIPVDTVNWVVSDLIEHGKVVRPVLGVDIATPQVARRLGIEGALVLEVQPGSGAAKAGMQPTRQDSRGRILLGDVILAVEDSPVKSSNDLFLLLEKKKVGEEVEITVRRDGRKQKVKVRLSAAPG